MVTGLEQVVMNPDNASTEMVNFNIRGLHYLRDPSFVWKYLAQKT